jgi:hypothetical protein
VGEQWWVLKLKSAVIVVAGFDAGKALVRLTSITAATSDAWLDLKMN